MNKRRVISVNYKENNSHGKFVLTPKFAGIGSMEG